MDGMQSGANFGSVHPSWGREQVPSLVSGKRRDRSGAGSHGVWASSPSGRKPVFPAQPVLASTRLGFCLSTSYRFVETTYIFGNYVCPILLENGQANMCTLLELIFDEKTEAKTCR